MFKKLKEIFSGQKKLNLFIIGLIFSAGVGITLALSHVFGTEKLLVPKTVKPDIETAADKKTGDILVGKIDEKTYLARLERNSAKTQNDIETMTLRIDRLENLLPRNQKNRQPPEDVKLSAPEPAAVENQTVSVKPPPTDNMVDRVANTISQFIPSELTSSPVLSNTRLEMVKLADVDKKSVKGQVPRLPPGSFCEGILLTSVYAPADNQNPLPVLIMLTDAFFGPNKTRIPLNGAFAIGKAVGDLVSRRAIIQIVSLSTVFTGGEVFENESNLGFVTDSQGYLGIPGEVVFNTGKQLGMSFLSGFMSGAGQAFADKESTTIVGSEGQTVKSITGNSGKYGVFSGLAKSAGLMSEYYQKQLDKLVPAVVIKGGQKVVFVMQKGVDLEGLKLNDYSVAYID